MSLLALYLAVAVVTLLASARTHWEKAREIMAEPCPHCGRKRSWAQKAEIAAFFFGIWLFHAFAWPLSFPLNAYLLAKEKEDRK